MLCYFFFFKQKTAYEMRISDWSSDVCSSDLLPGRHLQRQAAVGVQHEGGAVEHQLVLAADLVQVDQRQAALHHPRHRELGAHVELAELERRAVRHQQDLAAGLGHALDHLGGPDVLADRPRSEERRGVKEWVSKCRSRWSPFP